MKDIYLGSSSLNDGLSLEDYTQILNRFEELGGRVVDTATNYPINDNPKDFMLNVSQLFKIMKQSKMIVKLGAATNSGGPEKILNLEYLTMQRDFLIESYGEKINGFGIHWDDEIVDRQDLCRFLKDTYSLGFSVTLSGIRNDEAYARYLNIPIEYQIRSSPCDDYMAKAQELRDIFKDTSVVSYGIFGGKDKRCGEVSLSAKDILKNLSSIDKVIIMPSNIDQLEEYYV